MSHSKIILPTIVVAQFCCTSLWFAGNGVMYDLVLSYTLSESVVGLLTSAVQFGFIIGTLTFAIFTIADRFSPSKVFFTCAVLGSLFNVGIIWDGNSLSSILFFRFFTGFFLAGIYPIGMKIAADYYEKGLGKSLGYLVGALVLGTALPHLLKEVTNGFNWKYVILITSVLALLGGAIMILLVPDGPFRKKAQKLNLSAFFGVFKNKKFRSAAFGYFGHMWELYAFWAFVPIILHTYLLKHPFVEFNIPLVSFFIIGGGGLSCVIGGYLAQKFETKKVAFLTLILSCGCCLIAPFMFVLEFENLFIGFLLFWGMVVIADSPLFSTLVAENASAEIKGTALTIVNSLGFLISILSIQLLTELNEITDSSAIYLVLAIGPILGLWAMRKTT